MAGVVGVINNVATTVASQAEAFATAVVAAGAQIMNDFINVLAGPAGHDKVISEFSTQNSYLFTDDKYIDNLYNTDEIALNSLIKGTSFTNEIVDFYRKASSSTDYTNDWAVEDALNVYVAGQTHQVANYYNVWEPEVTSNYGISGPAGAGEGLDEILPSATLRVNNLNLFEGTTAPSAQYAGNNNNYSNFKWHVVLEDDDGMQGAEGYYRYAPTLNSTTFASVQQGTKNYLKALGLPDPENLLDDLPYSQHSNVIDSVFINFRVKWVSGSDSTTGNRISNKYLWLLAKGLYGIYDMPHTLTYTTDADGVDTISLFKHQINGDGHNYTMGASHVSTSTGNSTVTSSNPYQYDKDLTSNDGYYYYDANKTLPVGDSQAQTVSQVQSYLNDSSIGTTEVQANWLEIEENSVSVTVTDANGNSVSNVFPDEISLAGSNITLYASSTVTADDQVLRVGNLYIKKSSTEIMFATVPPAVYSEASVTYGRSNVTSVTYYTVHNVSAIERITDYANDYADANFRYITHKLDASNNCVSAPVIWEIYEALDPFEQHKLVMASANISLHLAYYERIEKTWEEKLRAATLEVIRIGAIVFAVYSLGSASSLVVLAETAIVAYATSLAVNAFIEHILVPVIISNFGEDEGLILLAVAAVAIAYYSSKSSTAGLNQFPNQVTLFTASIDIMNQMYSLAVVQPGLLEMQREQEELIATDKELTEKEEELQDEMDALFGTDNSPGALLNLQIRVALNPMPASAYVSYHDNILERQFDCYDYDKYNTLNVS